MCTKPYNTSFSIKTFRVIVFAFIFLFPAIILAGDTIKIASWNIQNFGTAKAKNTAKMAIIAKVISRFDIIAVQEISNLHERSDAGCPRNQDCPGNNDCNALLDSLKKQLSGNSDKKYEFIFSPQVKDERYLFIYDKNKVRALDSGKFIIDSGDDPDAPVCDENAEGYMARQPFYVTFKAGGFDFTLLTSHTKPDKNLRELQALAVSYWNVQSKDTKQNDIILLGDLNADCRYLSKKAMSVIEFKKPKYTWVIEDNADTTVNDSTNCAYDRIIFTQSTKEDYSGNFGIFRFDEEYNLSKKTGLGISDHYPVWAEFYTDKDTDILFD